MTFKKFNQIFVSLNKLFFSTSFIYDQKAVPVTKTHFEITQVKYTFYIYKLYLQQMFLVILYLLREI